MFVLLLLAIATAKYAIIQKEVTAYAYTLGQCYYNDKGEYIKLEEKDSKVVEYTSTRCGDWKEQAFLTGNLKGATVGKELPNYVFVDHGFGNSKNCTIAEPKAAPSARLYLEGCFKGQDSYFKFGVVNAKAQAIYFTTKDCSGTIKETEALGDMFRCIDDFGDYFIFSDDYFMFSDDNSTDTGDNSTNTSDNSTNTSDALSFFALLALALALLF